MSISNPDHFPRQLTVIIVNCHGAPCRAQRRPSVTRMETCRAHHAHLIRFSSLTEPQIRIQSHPRISVRPILSPHRRCDAHACSPGTRRRTSFWLLQAPTRSDISTTGRQTRLICGGGRSPPTARDAYVINIDQQATRDMAHIRECTSTVD